MVNPTGRSPRGFPHHESQEFRGGEGTAVPRWVSGAELSLILQKESWLSTYSQIKSSSAFSRAFTKAVRLLHPEFLLPSEKQLKIFNLFVKIFNVVLTVHQLFKSS